MTKLKKSNCDKTQKIKLWPNSKTQILTKLSSDSCDSSDNRDSGDNYDSSDSSDKKNYCLFLSLKLWEEKNSETEMVTSL